ncbi:MAG: ABC transporter permease [Myxococcota bacterium]|jgi:ABC-type multidrug transport system permease subunit|nr:ABC transporter permease [Myxococcota bacterium]MEC9439574.1 ABC transporter permease [Myxococcota bacterium]
MFKINWYQGSVLADRYLETILSDWKNTLLLLVQAPALAGMAVAVWGNIDSANNSLYFVMVLSCIWIGCMDSCREIVKERSLFLRERMFNLEIGAYLYSKLRVLFLLNIVQVVTYSLIVYKFLDVRVPIGWLILVLLSITMCGTCLGLLISALVKRSDHAVGVVPLVILPQILFSEFAISKDSFEGASEIVYKLMPSRWSYESLVEFAQTNPAFMEAGAMALPPLFFGLLFVLIAAPVLSLKKY